MVRSTHANTDPRITPTIWPGLRSSSAIGPGDALELALGELDGLIVVLIGSLPLGVLDSEEL